MSRRPRIEANPDGSAAVRIQIELATWTLVRAYAARIGLHDEDALRILLGQIDALIVAGDVPWLSADWRALLKEARSQSPWSKMIDVSRLHRSTKLRSGFYGVYAAGAQGFQATGRNGEYIVRCSTAEEAAWRRYQHYLQNDLPYGELEVTIDELRKSGEQGTDADLRRVALETAQLSGTLHLYADQMTEDERQTYSGPATAVPTMAGFAPGELEAASTALSKDEPTSKQNTSRRLTGKASR